MLPLAAESKANNNTLSEGSGKDSSVYEPDAIQEEEASLEGEVENKDADSHVTTVTAKKTNAKGKKNKTACKAEDDSHESITMANSKSQARNRSQMSQPRQKVTKGDLLLARQVRRRLLSRQSLKTIPWYNQEGWLSIIKITAKEKILATAREAHGGKPKWQQMHLPKEIGLLFTTKLIPYTCKHLLGATANPWVPLTVQEIQNAVDTIFGKDWFEVTGKGAIADYSDELSSPELQAEFIEWFVAPSGKACTAPFMWETWGNGSDASELFCHLLIVDTLAQAHFSNIIAISDPKSATRPIGAILLTIQAV
ncbi:hypothetical protein EDD85DRAFT_795531 [Armillaria nabsnona]|nr:hypothetical protein EDD85DRAFT_795531 [Armillaria nabsnona]